MRRGKTEPQRSQLKRHRFDRTERAADMVGAILIGIVLLLAAAFLGVLLYLRSVSGPSKRVSIPAGGHTLKTTVYGNLASPQTQAEASAADPRPGLIFLSGWSPSRIGWRPSNIYAGLCAKRLDCLCLTVSLRGMGSAGDIATLTRADFLDDATAAYDFLAALEEVDRQRISVVGESFGSYLACVLSAERPVSALALRVPTDFPDAGFDDTPQERIAGLRSLDWKQQEHAHSESRALDAIHAFSGDVLIVASEHDSFVPLQTTRNYLASASDPSRLTYRLMRGARHGLVDPFRQIEYVRILFEWIAARV